MKKKYIVIISLSIVAGLSLVGFAGYTVLSKVKPNGSAKKGVEKVAMYTVQGAQTIFFEGEFQSSQHVVFQTDMTKGTVDKINIQDRQKVKAGDILFNYKNNQIAQQKEELKYQLDTLKENYAKIKKQLDTPTAVVAPVQPAIVGDKAEQVAPGSAPNFAAQEALAKQSKEAGQSQLDENIRQQKRLSKQIEDMSAKSNVDIKAPFDGVVTKGGYSEAEPTKPILTLVGESMQVVCSVSEKDILKLNEGQAVTLSILGTGQSIKGKISHIETEPSQGAMPQMGAALQGGGQMTGGSSNAYKVSIQADSNDGIYSGFHVQVSTKAEKDTPKVPKTAVFKDGDKSYIWTSKDGTLKKEEVEVTDWNDKYVQVKKGVTFEDKVVREAKDTMKEGDKVD